MILSRFNNDKNSGDAGFPNIPNQENYPHIYKERQSENESQIKTLSQTEANDQTKTEREIMLKEKLEALVPAIEALLKDGITIFECFAVVKLFEPILLDFAEDKTEAEVLADVTESWQWADGKWKLVEMADEAIKLPFYAEPLDGWAIRKGIESVALPQLAHGIWSVKGKV